MEIEIAKDLQSSSTSSPWQFKAMKRPAAMKKPASQQHKKRKEEEAEKEDPGKENMEGEEEEPKEEEPEEEKPAQDHKHKKLTKAALADHQQFLKEAAQLKLQDAEFEKALAKLPEKQQQCLWKKFEANRKATGTEEEYKKTTTGSGALARKKKLLRTWCMDGGKVSEMYRAAMMAITLEKSHGVEKEWLSKKKMEDELGPDEMKARLKAGTLKWRRNPEDPRFFQFQKLSEKEATYLNKSKQSKVEASGSAKQKDMVSFDQLMLEEIDEEDFVMGAEDAQEESDTEGIDKELAKAMGIKDKEKDKDKDKSKPKDKWAILTEVGDGTKEGEIQDKLVKFKTEISKDLAALEGGAHALSKQKGSQALLKSVAGTNKKAQDSLQELNKLLGKKSLKKDVVVPGLTKALEPLKECKARKVQLNKALKAE